MRTTPQLDGVTWQMVAMPDGHQMHVGLTGPADGPLALLLHGFPDSPATWRHLAPLLAGRGHRVAMPWMRGLGGSELPASGRVDIGAQADDARQLHRVLDGGNDSVLVGHDWGALTAAEVMSRPDAPFAAAAVLAIPPVQVARHLTPEAAVTTLPQLWYQVVMAAPAVPGAHRLLLRRLVRELWQRWSPGYRPDPIDIETALAGMRGDGLDVMRRMYRTLPRTILARAVEGDIPSWTAPTSFLIGADDGCLHAEISVLAVAAGAHIDVMPGVGHFLHLEDPTAVAAWVLDALSHARTRP